MVRLILEPQVLLQHVAGNDVVYRLELTALETEAALDQSNLIEELRDQQDISALRNVVELIVDQVIVRAHEDRYEVRVKRFPP